MQCNCAASSSVMRTGLPITFMVRDAVNGRTEATTQGTARYGSTGPACGRGPIRRGGRSVAPPPAAAAT